MNKALIASDIREHYWSNRQALSKFKQMHFFRRAWRATGEARYAHFMREFPIRDLVPLTSKSLQSIDTLIASRHETRLPTKMAGRSPRKRKRYEGYAESPELFFFDRLIYNMSTAQYLSIEQLKPVKYRRLKERLRDFDLLEVYANRGAILDVGCPTVNSVMFLEQLGIVDIRQKYLDLMAELYFSANSPSEFHLDDKPNYDTFLYNLTHIIIADSKFYQRDVSEYKWVTKYFADNLDEILDRAGIDLLAEVVLCMKLTREERVHSVAYDALCEKIYSDYPSDRALAPEALMKRGHTNAVLMLAWSDNEQWWSGPSVTA